MHYVLSLWVSTLAHFLYLSPSLADQHDNAQLSLLQPSEDLQMKSQQSRL